MRVILVDDEPFARQVLSMSLAEQCPNVEILGEAGSVPEAVSLINKVQPDLVFLDVEMPGYTGFQLLDFFDKPDFKIIFTTAYQEYLLQALRVSAVDYLLKPIQIQELAKAVTRAQNLTVVDQLNTLHNLKTNLGGTSIKKIGLTTTEGLLFVELNNIAYLKAEGSYTIFVLADNQEVLVSKNIKEFEHLEETASFVKCHRSFMVNVLQVKQLVRSDGGFVVMSNGAKVSLSREKKDDFLEAMKRHGIV